MIDLDNFHAGESWDGQRLVDPDELAELVRLARLGQQLEQLNREWRDGFDEECRKMMYG